MLLAGDHGKIDNEDEDEIDESMVGFRPDSAGPSLQ